MNWVATTILSSFLGLAVAWDLRQHRIPNGLVAAYGLVGLGLAATTGLPAFGRAAAGMAAGLAFLIVPFALGFVGGGDAKFFAAVGAFLGPVLIFWAFLFGTALGAPLAAVVLWQRRWAGAPSSPRDAASAPALPYAVPLALGVVAALVCDWAGMTVG
jgi:prepilin peptidase CpaA